MKDTKNKSNFPMPKAATFGSPQMSREGHWEFLCQGEQMIDLSEWLMSHVYELELFTQGKSIEDLLCECLDTIEDLYFEAKDLGTEAFRQFQRENGELIEFHAIGKRWEQKLMEAAE